jgi:hypothetical protein
MSTAEKKKKDVEGVCWALPFSTTQLSTSSGRIELLTLELFWRRQSTLSGKDSKKDLINTIRSRAPQKKFFHHCREKSAIFQSKKALSDVSVQKGAH